jgi:hypothetical protein
VAEDLSPDEGVWGWTKYGRLSDLAAENIDVLWDHVVSQPDNFRATPPVHGRPVGPFLDRCPARRHGQAPLAARETRRGASTAWPGIRRPSGTSRRSWHRSCSINPDARPEQRRMRLDMVSLRDLVAFLRQL